MVGKKATAAGDEVTEITKRRETIELAKRKSE